jgi:two-component system nitrate/nitrite response regulator NarP
MTRVLVADDHPFIVAGVEAVLDGSAYEIIAKVSNGAALLEALPRARPDIILLDVEMPERDGIDVLLTLRSRGDTRPVVLLTASLDDRRLFEAVKAGVNGILLKEGAEETLVQCLDAVRNGKRWIENALLQRALDMSFDGQAADPINSLTTRERAVVSLVRRGLRNKEIASELGLTEGTVKIYLHTIYSKVGVDNRTELAVLAGEAKQS